ncbi:MAG: tetratricopeptide repeat protein, partial [Planctomycetes bacterium]|nr:tetratricopeptide repeat protein [Planctomycetota bacterium]
EGARADEAAGAAAPPEAGEGALLLYTAAALNSRMLARGRRSYDARSAALMERAAGRDPYSAEAAVALSRQRARDGSFERAEAELTRALTLYPDQARLLEERALLGLDCMAPDAPDKRRAAERQRAASADVDRALALDPRRPWCLYLRAVAAERADTAPAVDPAPLAVAAAAAEADPTAGLRAALAADPDFAPAHYGLAQLLRRLGRTREFLAADAEWRTRRTDLERQGHYATLGHALLRDKRYAVAARLRGRAVDMDASDGGAWTDLADASFRRQAWAQALSHYGQGVRADPALASTVYNRLLAILAAGVPAPFLLPEIERKSRAFPEDPSLHLVRGVGYTVVRRWEDATAALAAALERDPGFAVVHVVQASLLLDQGRLDEAVAELARVAQFDGRVGLYHFVRARLACRRGDVAGALAEARRAVEHGMDEIDAYRYHKDLAPLLQRAEFPGLFGR